VISASGPLGFIQTEFTPTMNSRLRRILSESATEYDYKTDGTFENGRRGLRHQETSYDYTNGELIKSFRQRACPPTSKPAFAPKHNPLGLPEEISHPRPASKAPPSPSVH